ncbi:MAG: leucine-rich repeat protein [Lachnotalea sp.]
MKKIRNLLKGSIKIGSLACAIMLLNSITAQAETYTITRYIQESDHSRGTITKTIDDEDMTVNGDYVFEVIDGFLKNVEPLDETNPSGNVVIPNNVKVVDSYAINHDTSIKKITIPSTVIAIDANAIMETGITELTIPSSVEYIGVYALGNNTKLSSVTIEKGCTHIDMYAFQDCTALKKIYLPTTIKKMSYNWTDANPFWKIEKQVTVYAKKGSFVYSYCKNILGMKVKDITPVKPGTVSSFKASKIKTNSLKLSWKKASKANEYYIYQYVNKKWSKIATTESTSYTVLDLESATTYKFKIVPYNSNKYSTAKGKSTTLSANTKTATPSLTAVTQVSNKSAVLTFEKEKTSRNYEVYVSTNGKKYSKVAKFKNSSSGKTTYTLKSGLKAGKTNYVKIKCYTTISGKKVYSKYSQVIKVKLNKME